MSAGRSGEIGLDKANAGMVLAAALLDEKGAVLVPCDATLTEGMLSGLRRRGIERCMIWVEDVANPAELARERARRLQRLEWLFRHSAGQPGTICLLAQLRTYLGGEQP